MTRQESEPIDRDKLKRPEQVSGWHSEGEGEPQQDFADIARHSGLNPEAEPDVARTSDTPRGQGAAESGFDPSGALGAP
jgi:hypothetical protein